MRGKAGAPLPDLGDDLPAGRFITAWLAELDAGAATLLLSDGIYEAVDADGRAYGVERVEALLRDRRQRPAAEIAAALRAALAAFSGGRPAADDRTGTLVQRLAS